MYLQINNLLDTPEIITIQQLLQNASFSDGSTTATGAAKIVKQNQQLPREHNTTLQVNQIIEPALQRNSLFREGALPKAILPFLIGKYETGQHYGWHVDSPLMYVHPIQIRCDISITLFLNNAKDYEGGALEIETDSGIQTVKLDAGAAILYPTTSLHQVTPVTSGTRLVAVSWIESIVQHLEERKILFQLKNLENLLGSQKMGSPEYLLAQQIHSNLLRKWC